MEKNQYRKKPVVIEAVQFTGDNSTQINFFTEGKSYPTDESIGHSNWALKQIIIPTLEGEMTASCNDWIIKGVKGEFYPCKPDIFEKTYEKSDIEHWILNPDITEIEKEDLMIKELIIQQP